MPRTRPRPARSREPAPTRPRLNARHPPTPGPGPARDDAHDDGRRVGGFATWDVDAHAVERQDTHAEGAPLRVALQEAAAHLTLVIRAHPADRGLERGAEPRGNPVQCLPPRGARHL